MQRSHLVRIIRQDPRRLTIGRRRDDLPVDVLQAPVVLDQFRRQPIQQLGMIRFFTHHAEVVWRRNDSFAEVMLPKPINNRPGRPYRALRPIGREEARLFEAVLQGGFALQGFRNKDIREALYGDKLDKLKRKRLSGRVTRSLSLLRSRKLIRTVSHTLYYRVTKLGHHVISTALRLRNLDVALVGS